MNPTVLIIEDDQLLSTMYSRALSDIGYGTKIIGDGREASTHLTKGDNIPDVIMLDLHLPNVAGDTLLRQIKADNRYDQTRVMIATADPLIGDRLSNEVMLVLIKPIDIIQLQQLARRLIPHS